MKIGILTFHSAYNFGANLQIQSTVEYLKNNGHEPRVINWIAKDMEERYDRSTPPAQIEVHKHFLKNHLPCTDLCRNEKEVAEVIDREKLDGVIIGSDAVLQHKTFLASLQISKKGIKRQFTSSAFLYPSPFWGNFIPLLKKRIPVSVLSASSQNTQYHYIRGRLKKKINNSLKQFELITVRDEWTKKMIEYLTKRKVTPSITPDPVFGYNQNVKKQFTKEQILEKFDLPEKYFLITIRTLNTIPKEWLDSFQTLAQKHNITCVALTMPKGMKFEHNFPKAITTPLCPKEWYSLIKYSSGYIGENMHPIVIALHNAVPFFAFDSYGIVRFRRFANEKSSKTYDILSRAGFLENYRSILGKRHIIPSPEHVINKIFSFDSEKCKQFSQTQLGSYNAMMQKILSFQNHE